MAEQWRVIDLCEFQGTLHSTRGGIEVCPEGKEPVTLPVSATGVEFLKGLAIHGRIMGE